MRRVVAKRLRREASAAATELAKKKGDIPGLTRILYTAFKRRHQGRTRPSEVQL